jgi:hypothetical protein
MCLNIIKTHKIIKIKGAYGYKKQTNLTDSVIQKI